METALCELRVLVQAKCPAWANADRDLPLHRASHAGGLIGSPAAGRVRMRRPRKPVAPRPSEPGGERGFIPRAGLLGPAIQGGKQGKIFRTFSDVGCLVWPISSEYLLTMRTNALN